MPGKGENKVGGKKTKGRRSGMKTQGRTKPVPEKIAVRQRIRAEEEKRRRNTWR